MAKRIISLLLEVTINSIRERTKRSACRPVQSHERDSEAWVRQSKTVSMINQKIFQKTVFEKILATSRHQLCHIKPKLVKRQKG